jgi:hypothetical protein
MKRIMLSVILLVLSANAFGQGLCSDIFSISESAVTIQNTKENRLDDAAQMDLREAAKKLVEQMSSLEKKIEWWSNLTGQYERTALFKLRDRRKKFSFYFETSGELYEAVNIYRDIFKDVELSFFKLQRYYGAEVAERDAIYSREELAAIEKVFGENYGDYSYVRQYLEKSMETLPVDATSPEGIAYSNAKYVLGRLGTPVIAERFADLNLTKERPGLDDIQNMFRDHPGPLIAKLRRDLRQERVLAIKTFVLGTLQVETLQKLIYKIIPTKMKEAVTNFLGINYNSYVLKRYLSDIELIVNAKTIEQQVVVFREIAAKHSSMEFYVTFVRLVSYSDTWIALRKSLEEHKDEPIYARIVSDMKKAEEELKKYNFLPQFHEPSLIDHFTKWIAPIGVSTAIYVYGDFTVVKQGVIDMYQYVSGMF